jgi:hypothetical protein
MNYQRQTSNVANGTGFQGYATATLQQLKDAFGDPEIMKDYDKVTHLWVVNIEGVLCTIYDYKENLDTGKTEDWHVGGKVAAASLLVNAVLKNEETL